MVKEHEMPYGRCTLGYVHCLWLGFEIFRRFLCFHGCGFFELWLCLGRLHVASLEGSKLPFWDTCDEPHTREDVAIVIQVFWLMALVY